MKRIAVTGGIGSGKSVAARRLAERGALVFDADSEARTIMTEDPAVRAALVSALGEQAYLDDGSLNKPFVARTIFGQAEKRKMVNEIVHPAVYRSFESFCAESESRSPPMAVIESAVLFDLGEVPELDAIVVIEASREARIARVAARDHQEPETVKQRMAGQLPNGAFAERADYLVVNHGTVQDLERTVDALFDLLMQASGNPDD